jgi:hypothetical protein
MTVLKLNEQHSEALKFVFSSKKYMGVSLAAGDFLGRDKAVIELEPLETYFHANFCNAYLAKRKNHHAYGYFDETGNITATIGFYESSDDASWYWNMVRTTGSNQREVKHVLDAVIKHNEERGRLKFYSMFPLQYRKVYRRMAFSEWASERYDYFDEFYVEAKNQCRFTLPWQIMFNRTLVPTDSLVRCTFLKQKYRDELFNGGAI